MTYPRHWLFAFGGSMLEGEEIWQNTIRFALEGSVASTILVDEEATLERLFGPLATKFQGSPSSGGLGYSSSTYLQWGKFNEIDAEGKYLDEGSTTRKDVPGTGYAPAGPPPTFAPQLALAVSWVTDKTRGLANKGRIYIPMPQLTPDATGQLPPSLRQNIATNWVALLNTWNDEGGLDTTTLRAHVVSGVRGGAKEAITGVRVGSVLDTMRSRRNALNETYTTVMGVS